MGLVPSFMENGKGEKFFRRVGHKQFMDARGKWQSQTVHAAIIRTCIPQALGDPRWSRSTNTFKGNGDVRRLFTTVQVIGDMYHGARVQQRVRTIRGSMLDEV
jgi:hypothetical protein